MDMNAMHMDRPLAPKGRPAMTIKKNTAKLYGRVAPNGRVAPGYGYDIQNGTP